MCSARKHWLPLAKLSRQQRSDGGDGEEQTDWAMCRNLRPTGLGRTKHPSHRLHYRCLVERSPRLPLSTGIPQLKCLEVSTRGFMESGSRYE